MTAHTIRGLVDGTGGRISEAQVATVLIVVGVVIVGGLAVWLRLSRVGDSRREKDERRE